MFDVTHGMHAVFMENGVGAPSSANTHVWPQATVLLRLRSVSHAAGGAVCHAVFQTLCRLREVDVIFGPAPSVLSHENLCW